MAPDSGLDVKTCVIVNPESRQGEELDVGLVEQRLPGSRAHHSRAPGHASQIAAEAVAAGCETIVAAGGDGTLNQVVGGIGEAADRVRLGILPLGTGNDFAQALGIPLDLDDALRVIATGDTLRCDLARIECGGTSRLMINTSAGGFSSEVGEALSSEIKERWGPFAYLRAAIQKLPELESYRLSLALDEGESVQVEAQSLVVANGRFIAAGVPIAPLARVDDGLLDVVVVCASSVPALAGLGAQILAGAHLNEEAEGIFFRQASRLEVETDPALPFNVDGEPLGEGKLRFQMEPAAVRVIVDRDRYDSVVA